MEGLDKLFLANELSRTSPYNNDGWGDIQCFSTHIFPEHKTYTSKKQRTKTSKLINDMHFWHLFRCFMLLDEQLEHEHIVARKSTEHQLTGVFIYSLAHMLYNKNRMVALTLLNRFRNWVEDATPLSSEQQLTLLKIHEAHLGFTENLFSASKVFLHTHEEAHRKIANSNTYLENFKRIADDIMEQIVHRYYESQKLYKSVFTDSVLWYKTMGMYGDLVSSEKLNDFFEEMYADYTALDAVYNFLKRVYPDKGHSHWVTGAYGFSSRVIDFLYCLTSLREHWLKYLYISSQTEDGAVRHTRISYSFHRGASENGEFDGLFDRYATMIRSVLPMFMFCNNKRVDLEDGNLLHNRPKYTNSFNVLRDLDFVNDVLKETQENKEYLIQKHGDKYLSYVDEVFVHSLNVQDTNRITAVAGITLPKNYCYKNIPKEILYTQSMFDDCLICCNKLSQKIITLHEFGNGEC